MEISLNELLTGKGTLIKNKEYLSTEAYVTPFIERMSKFTTDFRIQVKLPDQISISKKEDLNLEDTVFNRVWVQAVLPEEYNICGDGHRESVNLLYALDTRKPVVKLFRNLLNMACLNMCVFSPSAIQVSELAPESQINYKFINDLMNMSDDTKTTLEKLKNRVIRKSHIYDTLGHWVDYCIRMKYDNGFGKVKIAESTPVEAYKSIFIDKESQYYTESDVIDFYRIYNAWTYLICNDKGKDIVNKFEKSYLAAQILDAV